MTAIGEIFPTVKTSRNGDGHANGRAARGRRLRRRRAARRARIGARLAKLLGIPPAANMPGKVIVDAFVDAQSLPRRREPYTRTQVARDGTPATSPADQAAIIDRLKKLGYVQ